MSVRVMISESDTEFKEGLGGDVCYVGPQRLPELKIQTCSHCGEYFFDNDTAEVIWITVNRQWVANGVFHGRCHPKARGA